MENISYIGLSQQVALKQQMDISANNLANINTPGFKSKSILFLEYMNKPREGGDTVKQVIDYGSYRDLQSGSLKQTFNDLDVALQGDGYFEVETPDGPRMTRDGGFSLNSDRELVNKSGYKVIGDGGPITLQEDAHKVTITGNGTVSTEFGEVGKLKVSTFENQQKMKEVGENLYDATALTEIPVDNPRVVQGSLESANVNPIVETNKMIEILRLYQATQRMLVNDHERIRTAIQKLTKV